MIKKEEMSKKMSNKIKTNVIRLIGMLLVSIGLWCLFHRIGVVMIWVGYCMYNMSYGVKNIKSFDEININYDRSKKDK